MKKSLRTCIGCRKVGSQEVLVRVVVQGGEFAVDKKRSLPGRGCYLHLSLDCIRRSSNFAIWSRALRLSSLAAGSPEVSEKPDEAALKKVLGELMTIVAV